MRRAFVPPADVMARETITAGTEPGSLMKKIRLALFKPGSRRMVIPFPVIMWMHPCDKNKKYPRNTFHPHGRTK